MKFTMRALLLVPLVLAGCLTVAEAKPKNVVFIILDDLRPRLGCYGDQVAVTPSIDALAKESTLFTSAYCQYPTCNPSRSSFMTGLRPDSTGVLTNESFDLSPTALKNALVLNRYLANSGYNVKGLGKIYHDGEGPKAAWNEPYVASKWLDYARPDNKAIGDNYFSPNRPKDQKLPSSWEAEDLPDDGYTDGMVAREAVKSLNIMAGQDKPFALFVGFRHPHLPWCAPKKYWDLYNREAMPIATGANREFPKGAPEVAINRFGELWSYADIPEGIPLTEDRQKQSMHAYYACVSYTDAQVGKVVAALKDLNVYDDTVLVVVSDNGYQMGDNGTWSKEVNWEATAHVVLLMRSPGQGQSGHVVKKLVELVDIYPTVCASVGLPTPAQCEGKSLLPLMNNPNADWSDIAFNQFYRRNFVVPSIASVSEVQHTNVMGRSIRTERYRFTLWESAEGRPYGCELYDLQVDPQGNINLAGQEDAQATVQELTKLLRDKWPVSHKMERPAPPTSGQSEADNQAKVH